MSRAFRVLLLVGALLGLLASGQLTWVHYKVHTEPTHRSLCAINARFDCDVVATAPQSTLLGVPIALWGALTYGLLLWLALRARRRPVGFPARPLAWAALMTVPMAAYSGYLAYVSATQLETFCLFCAFLWGVNGVLLLGALVCARGVRPLAGLGADLALARRAPRGVARAGLVPGVVAALLVVGVPGLYPEETRPGLGASVVLPEGALPEGLPVRGPADAPHLLVMVGDYRCPFCREAHRAIEAFRREHPERVRVAHLHFPLEEGCNPLMDWRMHVGACEASRAAECARLQGRYWEMADALFDYDEEGWDPAAPARLARRLGLDVDAFARCMAEDETVRATIAREVELAVRLNVQGTPTVYVDGRMHLGPIDARALEELLR